MPTHTKWIEPETFLKHSGVTVYHTYKNDDIDQGMNRYWFTLNTACNLEQCRCDLQPCPYVFDVRTLPDWHSPKHPPHATGKNDSVQNQIAWKRFYRMESAAIKTAIRKAIDGGLLLLPHRNSNKQGA